jgi:hypothetical protein
LAGDKGLLGKSFAAAVQGVGTGIDRHLEPFQISASSF